MHHVINLNLILYFSFLTEVFRKPMDTLYKRSKNTITPFKISANSKVVGNRQRENFSELFSGIPCPTHVDLYVSGRNGK